MSQNFGAGVGGGLPRNFARAFDLSSLKKPTAPSNSDKASSHEFGRAVTRNNLIPDFVDASQSRVVLLHFWSSRSPSSMAVLKMLAKFHHDDQGSWILGSVNIDQEPEIVQAVQVKAVPSGVILLGGNQGVIYESAPEENELRATITQLLSMAANQGLDVSPMMESAVTPEDGERLEPEEELALEAMANGDYVGAKQAYQAWLNRSPGESLAQLGLAQCELMQRIDGLDYAIISGVAETKPHDIPIQLQCADLEVSRGSFESAFNRLLNLIKNTSGDERNQVKDHLLGLFLLVDPADPILKSARSRLASALF